MTYEIFPGQDETLVTLGLRFRILDVRDDHECRLHPIVSDYRIAFKGFNPKLLDMPRDKHVLVVCETGQRGLAIATQLRQAGWQNAFSLSGGLANLLRTDTAMQSDIQAA